MLVVMGLRHVIVCLIGSSTMDRALPALIELRILSSHVITQNRRLLYRLEHLARVAMMISIVTARASHLNHIHYVLGVWILLLSEVEQFEFLPHG